MIYLFLIMRNSIVKNLRNRGMLSIPAGMVSSFIFGGNAPFYYAISVAIKAHNPNDSKESDSSLLRSVGGFFGSLLGYFITTENNIRYERNLEEQEREYKAWSKHECLSDLVVK
jgi:hypothetical protein